MQATNFWNKFNIHGYKVIILTLLLVGSGLNTYGQRNIKLNLQNFDNRFVHFGYLIGLHSSKARIEYSDQYIQGEPGSFQGFLDSLHSIIPQNSPGFKVGFIANFHILQYLDIRALIQVSFSEYSFNYRFTKPEQDNIIEVRDPTTVEVPILFKYKSVRRGNVGMYFVGGIKPYFQAAARGERDDEFKGMSTKKFGASIDVGVGFDMFYPLFKFSPEVRYSYGLTNMLKDDPNNAFNAPLKRLVYHNISLFITFEGGPD